MTSIPVQSRSAYIQVDLITVNPSELRALAWDIDSILMILDQQASCNHIDLKKYLKTICRHVLEARAKPEVKARERVDLVHIPHGRKEKTSSISSKGMRGEGRSRLILSPREATTKSETDGENFFGLLPVRERVRSIIK